MDIMQVLELPMWFHFNVAHLHVTDKCLLHFQIQDHAGLDSYNIFSRFSDFKLCSLLLKVDLTPDTKKFHCW